MRFEFSSSLAFALLASAAPAIQKEGKIALPLGVGLGPVLGHFVAPGPQFSNLTCKLENALFPGQPLHQLFPTSNLLGSIIGPALKNLIGADTVDDIDAAADELCISAQQDKNDGDGACQFALSALNSFVEAKAGQAQADKYRCLLNFLCVAPTGSKHPGTCSELLAGLDCNANRLVSPSDKECEGKSS